MRFACLTIFVTLVTSLSSFAGEFRLFSSKVQEQVNSGSLVPFIKIWSQADRVHFETCVSNGNSLINKPQFFNEKIDARCEPIQGDSYPASTLIRYMELNGNLPLGRRWIKGSLDAAATAGAAIFTAAAGLCTAVTSPTVALAYVCALSTLALAKGTEYGVKGTARDFESRKIDKNNLLLALGNLTESNSPYQSLQIDSKIFDRLSGDFVTTMFVDSLRMFLREFESKLNRPPSYAQPQTPGAMGGQ